MAAAPRRARNDLRQYDDLAASWWDPQGPFAALHWLAKARGALIPPRADPQDRARLLDVGCGGGLLAPHVPDGYEHVGVDLTQTALDEAARHGVTPVRADAADLPFDDASFDVVVAGEVLEHVPDLPGTVSEALRVLRPGGTFVCDTINRTLFARITLVMIGERIRGGPPPACHDPSLFVPPQELQRLCREHGVELEVWGLQPAPRQYVAYLLRRRRSVEMVRTRSLAAVYQGRGVKGGAPDPRTRNSAA